MFLVSNAMIPKPRPMSPVQLSWSFRVVLQPIFKFFSSPFDANCEKVPLKLQMKLIDLQTFKRFKFQVSLLSHPRFLTGAYIWTIPQPYHPHPESREDVWHYMPLWIVEIQNEGLKSTLNSQLSNHHLSDHQWSGRHGFNPRSRHTKNFKSTTWCLLA